MGSRVRDLQRRLGLRGAIFREGEQWRTGEVRRLITNMQTFYRGYEQYLDREEPYPNTFDTDIDSMLDIHGPVLWPDGPRDQKRQPWLYRAEDIPRYLEDLHYSVHRDDKIRPLFVSLLSKNVAPYHANKKYARQKIKAKVEEGAITTTTTSNPSLPRSSLTDAGTAADEPCPSGRSVKCEQKMAAAAKLPQMTVGQGFLVRKRKRGADSPIIRASKTSRTSVVKSLPTREDKATTTKNEKSKMRGQKKKATEQEYERGLEQEHEHEQEQEQQQYQEEEEGLDTQGKAARSSPVAEDMIPPVGTRFSDTLGKHINMRGTRSTAGLRPMLDSTRLIENHFAATIVKSSLDFGGRRIHPGTT